MIESCIVSVLRVHIREVLSSRTELGLGWFALIEGLRLSTHVLALAGAGVSHHFS
jgi:hypothetical protein